MVRAYFVMAVATLFVDPPRVHAFCRTTTVEPQSSCPEVCVYDGVPLHWLSPEMTFVLNERAFPAIPGADLRRIVGSSFAAWEGITCDGQRVDLRFSLDPGTTTEGAVHHATGPNQNVLVYEDAAGWIAAEHSPAAFAVTTVAFSRSTGAIREADIEFNGGMPTWVECPSAGCEGSPIRTDLGNVLTHELGHTLGLAHSDVRAATMSCAASAGETDKRSLAEDDDEAICAAYPPNAAFAFAPSTLVVRGGTCGVQRGARDGASLRAFALALVLAAGVRRVRRARPARTKHRGAPRSGLPRP